MKSIRELYKIGRGPSSSHTMGPEKACRLFVKENGECDEYKVTLFGSLAATGKGHLTDKVVKETLGEEKTEVIFDGKKTKLPHPNTMYIEGLKKGVSVAKWEVTSVGGGAIKVKGKAEIASPEVYPHGSYEEIKEFCLLNHIKLWQYAEIFEGEGFWDYLSEIWQTMNECVDRGLKASGVLPGGINTQRKAKTLYDQYVLNEKPETRENRIVCSYAYAAAEENAGGGKVVTAPTCGSCGVIPAVFRYLQEKNEVPEKEILKALATAGVIGNLIKTNASISGAECGCQAEVGVACSMASAGVAQLYNMTVDQIEYASEIAIEHHLGLTCDPICGLVQIPCIERNAVAALRALNEVTLAGFLSDSRKISLDMAIKTMYDTGRDISGKYRETSKGGLAKLYN
ncbi:MAG: L-serine ammonia-lyase, iron-sulfur-dependent, subunit alpha [Clostridia bacterium]|nr:L-serine ammonia-lyase, iron-sulfur-dependent, subunit alpha [Clostridia bacterium]